MRNYVVLITISLSAVCFADDLPSSAYDAVLRLALWDEANGNIDTPYALYQGICLKDQRACAGRDRLLPRLEARKRCIQLLTDKFSQGTQNREIAATVSEQKPALSTPDVTSAVPLTIR